MRDYHHRGYDNPRLSCRNYAAHSFGGCCEVTAQPLRVVLPAVLPWGCAGLVIHSKDYEYAQLDMLTPAVFSCVAAAYPLLASYIE